jgi:hypothetical protein
MEKTCNIKRITVLLACLLICIGAHCQTLLLYGGDDHDVYLGKLNGSDYDTESIWNPYGTYGNKYSSKSIWNEYGSYGSEYGSNSPFNPYALDPPVIVDEDGNFYGYFTINQYKSERADFELVSTIYKYYDMIRDDVSRWYDKIFD